MKDKNESIMKTRDEILENYQKRVNDSRNYKMYETTAIYILGWVLGFTEEEIDHDLEHGI